MLFKTYTPHIHSILYIFGIFQWFLSFFPLKKKIQFEQQGLELAEFHTGNLGKLRELG